MYKDLITYQLAEDTSQDQLISIAQQIVQTWMKKQAGFIKWEIHTNSDGSYTDIVSWESKAAARKAEEQMVNIPNAGDWFACYKEGSVNSIGLSSVAKF